jgi:hypothetical protein
MALKSGYERQSKRLKSKAKRLKKAKLSFFLLMDKWVYMAECGRMPKNLLAYAMSKGVGCCQACVNVRVRECVCIISPLIVTALYQISYLKILVIYSIIIQSLC